MKVRTRAAPLWLAVTAIGVSFPTHAEDISGTRVFQARCAACHALDEHRWGPALRGVVGRPVANQPGYDYSRALKSARFQWTEELLDRWLQNPAALVPGARMRAHFSDAKERDAVIAYLKAQGGVAERAVTPVAGGS